MTKPTGTPTHHVFVVDGEGEKARWTRIGSAWPHADGSGLNVTLNVLPLSGRIVVRVAKADGPRARKGRGQ